MLLTRRAWLGVLCTAAVFGTAAQSPSQSVQLDKPERLPLKQEPVQYLYPEQITAHAGKSTAVVLHFRVAPGLHVNSHSPKDESLIPTALSIPAESGVKLDAATYPQGTDFTLPAEPQSKLSVYTGDFAIQARITAAPGDHLVEAKLRYQACDQQQCMPPKTATVAIDVIGK
ncbi:protein-disulfide reductase DsbD domain-containing protein [Terracidiphilus gabretensis]|jgi:Disulphide bond corrector protein DsbC|uniref:protein-disulfide reductase DsbD domain-containing protein n=1 Tax=Terracidiphilus gabretensis TaxID=1577687 RepID=UPI00071B1C51|nr:protein-disulfide reductase DsbD domain-containing protein [Terracidiphilus gabretensis]